MSEDQEKVYRPQRKREPISMSDITGEQPINSQEQPASLQDVLSVQRTAGINIPQENQSFQSYNNAMPQPRDGINITGKIPPAMQAILQQRIAEVESENANITQQPIRQNQTSQQTQPMRPFNEMQQLPSIAALRPGQLQTNDPNLNALLGAINTQTYERVLLPSRGQFYTDADQPQTGELHLRPMTGQEEAILSTARFVKSGRSLDMIFRNCIQEKNINPEKLLIIDRTYLLIYLRAISYGNMYEVSIKCPECNHTFDYEIDLNIPLIYCPDNFTTESLQKTLPKSGFTFRYRLARGTDESDVSAYREHKSKFSQTTNDTFFYNAAMLIEEIGNETAILKNRYGIQSLLERLPAADVNCIRNALNNTPFGAQTNLSVLCPSCSMEFQVELPFETSFFYPKEKTENERL